jgi:hypothetical protein
LIKGSKYVLFEGMGHNLPPAVIPDLIANMTSHINAVEAATEALAIEPAP